MLTTQANFILKINFLKHRVCLVIQALKGTKDKKENLALLDRGLVGTQVTQD